VAVRYAGQDVPLVVFNQTAAGTNRQQLGWTLPEEHFDLHTGRQVIESDYAEDSNKCIIEEIVRPVGCLPELNEDSWSKKVI
jgi:hypothetical protein